MADLCAPEAKVTAQTVADIATGRRPGSVRSRFRILNALNSYARRSREYSLEDLFPAGRLPVTSAPADTIEGKAEEKARAVEGRLRPLAESLVDQARILETTLNQLPLSAHATADTLLQRTLTANRLRATHIVETRQMLYEFERESNRRYIELNKEIVERSGVERVFLILKDLVYGPNGSLDPLSVDILNRQHEAGIDVRIAWLSLLPQRLRIDVVLFDYDSVLVATGLGPLGGSYSAFFSSNESIVKYYEEAFQEIRSLAIPLEMSDLFRRQ